MADNSLSAMVPQLLAQGLLALREMALMPQLVNRAYEPMAGPEGSSITVPIPSAIAAVEVTPAKAAPTTEGVIPTSVSIPLDQWWEAPFYLTDKEKLEVQGGFLPSQASEAIRTLANNVDTYLLNLGKKFYGVSAFAGSGATPFGDGTTNDAAQARKVLSNQLAPLSTRRVVFDPDAEASASNLRAFQDASFGGGATTLIEGTMTRKFGFDWFMDQNVPLHTTGTQTSTPHVTANEAIGQKVINLTCAAGEAVDIVEGDIIKFANHTQTYVATADAAIAASAVGDLNIEPGLVTAVPITTVFSINGGVAGSEASHALNLAFHRDAIAFATRPLEGSAFPRSVVAMDSRSDPVSGLTLRLEITREHKRDRYSFDILYGANVVRRELGCRLFGSTA